MLRGLVVLGILLSLVGCRSQYGAPGCGNRVPPPSTGSYGVPNAYYQNVPPRTSAVPFSNGMQPNGAPRATNPSLGGWRSVSDQETAPAPVLAANETPRLSDSAVVTTSSPIATVRPASSSFASSSNKLRGMPINEAKRPVTTAAHVEP